uniref:Uncharacterized protein n=1 Tax=Ciona intestinalis TaxID=7719 RepID=H2Y1S3_CIOIN
MKESTLVNETEHPCYNDCHFGSREDKIVKNMSSRWRKGGAPNLEPWIVVVVVLPLPWLLVVAAH